jgi:hypothetical protein
MGKPHIHAQNSVNRWGGKVEDYLPIHELLDSSAVTFGDVRHRTLTHNQWFIRTILPKVLGITITNSDGKTVSTIEIAEWHVLEDFGNKFIPAVSDYLAQIPLKPWMDNARDGETPPSRDWAPKSNEEALEFLRNGPKDPVEVERSACWDAPPGTMD